MFFGFREVWKALGCVQQKLVFTQQTSAAITHVLESSTAF